MSTLAILDLTLASAIDREAMNRLVGGDTWIQTSVSSSISGWGGYQRESFQKDGVIFLNGVLHRRSSETWKRTRTQTEYSSWYHYDDKRFF